MQTEGCVVIVEVGLLDQLDEVLALLTQLTSDGEAVNDDEVRWKISRRQSFVRSPTVDEQSPARSLEKLHRQSNIGTGRENANTLG